MGSSSHRDGVHRLHAKCEVLEVRAHHLRFTIETKAALKFDSAADQVAFGHLNLRFNGAMLPATSRGLLAQLAGRREVTSHSEERFQLRRNRKAKRQAERLAGLMRKRDAQRASGAARHGNGGRGARRRGA